MSALAYFFEEVGLATVVVALVREHVELMRPPRALWVPFELGRPFGTPGETESQTDVLLAALRLLDKPGPGPILQDYSNPFVPPQKNQDWRFPGQLETADLYAEMNCVVPLWQRAKQRCGRTTVGISGLSPEDAFNFIHRYHSPDPMPNPVGMSTINRVRFAVDDIKAIYLEAATADAGNPSSAQLLDWFWEQTLAGSMLRELQDRVSMSEDKNLQLIAGSLVPAERVNALR